MNDQMDLQALLEKYEKQRAELDIVIAHLRKALGLSDEVDIPVTVSVTEIPSPIGNGRPAIDQEIRSDTFFQMSIPAAAKK